MNKSMILGATWLMVALGTTGTARAQVGDVLLIDLGKLADPKPATLMTALQTAGGVTSGTVPAEVTVPEGTGAVPASIQEAGVNGTIHYFTSRTIRVLSCEVQLYSSDGAGAGAGSKITALRLIQWMRAPENRTAGEALKDLEAFFQHWLKKGSISMNVGHGLVDELPSAAVAIDSMTQPEVSGSLLGMSLDG